VGRDSFTFDRMIAWTHEVSEALRAAG
jgi:hypothetical protein